MGARRFSLTFNPRTSSLLTAFVVSGACAFVFWQLRPDLLFADTTPTGGDLGAQVWGPAYLRDHLLPHGRLSGWAPDWYGGFPWLTFYFPLPALLVVLVDVVLPYNVAFKLVAVLGVVTLPAAAWAFGKLLGLPRTAPTCLAAATLPFVFDGTFYLYGGNILSTLAGEFSYGIGLSVALVFLGVYARALATGRHRALAALLLAVTALCHVVPALFAGLGAVVLTVSRCDRRRLLGVALPTGVVAALLTAFWTVPFLARLPYTTQLGFPKVADYDGALLTRPGPWLVLLAAAGVVVAVVRRCRPGLELGAMVVLSAVAFVVAPEGRLWNARLLPFWLLGLHLLAGYAVAELAPLVGRAGVALIGSDDWERRRPAAAVARRNRTERGFALAAPIVVLVAALTVVLPLANLPRFVRTAFAGYERNEFYPEYRAVVDTMRQVGRTEGCGRALWEYGEELDRFGTAYGLMLLPYWTDGCIGSMHGLVDESAASSPYVSLAEAELSRDPSTYIKGLPYRKLDVAKGVEHLQLLGVRYYVAFTDEAREQARAVPSLRPVATTGPHTVTIGAQQWQATWEVFQVAGSDLVVPLAYEPVVSAGGGGTWLDLAVDLYQDSSRWDVPLAANGPRAWRRARGTDADPPRRAVPPVTVSNIRADDDSISFDVDRVRSPVLVKASYFPNWRVRGARGVWRATPNHMVVVPTARHVTLSYGVTAAEQLGRILSLLGVVGLVVFWRRGRSTASGPSTMEAEETAWTDRRQRVPASSRA